MGFRRRVQRTDRGIQIAFSDDEREVVAHVLGQLRDALVADAEDGVLRRLFPPAYADDPDKEAGYRALAHDELLESRLAALDVVETSLGGRMLDDEEANAWLRSMNALRLVLGTRLDVSEDEEPDLDPDDPETPVWALYYFLSAVVDELVEALAADLPPVAEE